MAFTYRMGFIDASNFKNNADKENVELSEQQSIFQSIFFYQTSTLSCLAKV